MKVPQIETKTKHIYPSEKPLSRAFRNLKKKYYLHSGEYIYECIEVFYCTFGKYIINYWRTIYTK